MDVYFVARDDRHALTARDLPGGPGTGDDSFDAVEAKDVMVCPHLEQLVEIATGAPFGSCMAELGAVWPPAEARTDPESPLLGDPTIDRLPDRLVAALAALEPTPEVAGDWQEELWSYETEDALRVMTALGGLARRARDADLRLYWWSEL